MKSHVFGECTVGTGRLCDVCLKSWLDRKPPKGTWRDRQTQLEREAVEEHDAQLEAGHA